MSTAEDTPTIGPCSKEGTDAAQFVEKYFKRPGPSTGLPVDGPCIIVITGRLVWVLL